MIFPRLLYIVPFLGGAPEVSYSSHICCDFVAVDQVRRYKRIVGTWPFRLKKSIFLNVRNNVNEERLKAEAVHGNRPRRIAQVSFAPPNPPLPRESTGPLGENDFFRRLRASRSVCMLKVQVCKEKFPAHL